MFIERAQYVDKLTHLLKFNPVVGLIGSRQVGKTTLAKTLKNTLSDLVFFDLEDPRDAARLQEPMMALEPLSGLVVIDEIQHQPNLFKVLRVLADRNPLPCRFLVLGSASPDLLKQSAESLAGRIAYLEMDGFSLQEVGKENLERLWLRGSFPRSFLSSSEQTSFEWRQSFIKTFLERDLPQLGITIPSKTLSRFWMMLAHYHGQIWNASEFSRAFGMSDKTVRSYLDLLSSTFVVRQLQPWWENISKRQVKSPKIYIHDSGILHTLIGLETLDALSGHVKVGASWEGFAINTILNVLNIQSHEAYFWSAHSGAELDLLVVRGQQRIGFEFKRTLMPQLTHSLLTAIKDLKLSKAYLVHAGQDSFPLSEQVTALGLHDNPAELNIL
ncbi:MAG: ATP-binding protein [Gammaproteobacteria bacterium]